MVAGGAADVSGDVKVGDRIKSVDGVNCADKDFAFIRSLTSGTRKPCFLTFDWLGDGPSASMLPTPEKWHMFHALTWSAAVAAGMVGGTCDMTLIRDGTEVSISVMRIANESMGYVMSTPESCVMMTSLGLSLGTNAEDPYVQITGMLPEGPADASRLIQIGDKIKSVEGKDCAGQDFEFVRRLTTGEVGSTCNLVLLRDGAELAVAISRVPVGPQTGLGISLGKCVAVPDWQRAAMEQPETQIGVVLHKDDPADTYFTVVDMIPGGPAYNSGKIVVGDKIKAIEGQDCAHKDLYSINLLTKGFVGTECNMVLLRGGTGAQEPVSIVRTKPGAHPEHAPGSLGVECYNAKPQDPFWSIGNMIPGGPAQECGQIFKGDTLMAADGRSLQNVSLKELAQSLRGPIGSTKKLLIWRAVKAPGDVEYVNVEIEYKASPSTVEAVPVNNAPYK